ncbi:hypothetical protein [Solidesulfovibrio sp.]
MLRAFLAAALFCLTLSLVAPTGAQAQPAAEGKPSDDLQKLTQESSNPVGSLWMITNQFNFNVIQSPRGHLFKKPRTQFNYNFQPVMTFDLSSDYRLIARPVIPVYNSPYAESLKTVNYTFGLGDAELMAMVAPSSTDSGFLFGVGPTAVFPTATGKELGSGKWQLGVAAAAVFMNDTWVAGIFPQQWWSVGGDPSRKEVSLTKAQYFLWYSPAKTWQVGMSPNILIDWTQKDADNALTLPVGLGVAKLFTLGKLPLKISAEADYSVVRPRHAGTEWTFKFTLTPILPKLF